MIAASRWKLLLLPAVLAVTAGCARVGAKSTVAADGSFTRTLEFHGPAPAKGGMSMGGPTLEQTFNLPKGAGWTVKKTVSDQETLYTATHSYAKGQTASADIVLLGKPGSGKSNMTNTVTVREIAPGRLEYREVLHWTGERPKDVVEMTSMSPEDLAGIKNALPTAMATDANARQFAHIAMRELVHVLFGPSDPLLPQMMMQPEMMEYKFNQRMGKAVDTALREQFGDKLTNDQRLVIARKLFALGQAAEKRTTAKTKSKADSPADQDSSALASLVLAVKLPGKVVSTNGEIDELSGSVFWGLFAPSVAIDDVTLVAVCDVSKTAAR